ncbi:MAG: tRNA uridine-5-carboxymethylaminomethyl(34) synthesis GTPase MnmE [Acutalibacteraceae bacterium]
MSRVIAAIATPPAAAGLGTVRLSGDGAVALAARIFRPASAKKTLEQAPGYTALYGTVFDADGDIDDAVALVFLAPHSYTGEDTVELSCHGGLYLLRRVLRAALDAGAAPAGPGEFTRRAFLSGKLDLTGAESVMDSIAATGRLAAKAALSARQGHLAAKMDRVRQSLTALAAQAAAFVDYPDDDIPDLEPAAMRQTLTAAKAQVEGLLATFDAGKVLREGIDTAIVGRPNVGKSTLMNALAGHERSIVTAIPGTTRDVVEETVRLGEVTLRLSDTAGLRQSDDEVEAIGVDRALKRMETAALVLFLLDGGEALTGEDRRRLEALRDTPTVAVINKADRPLALDPDEVRALCPYTVVLSAREGTGIDALRQAVETLTGVAALDDSQPILTTERQRGALRRCKEALEEAIAAVESGMTPDVTIVSVDSAIDALLELTGKRATETVVDEVFARFCVGK